MEWNRNAALHAWFCSFIRLNILREYTACSAGAETIVYSRGLLLLAALVWEKNTVLAEIYDRLRPSEQADNGDSV